MLYDLIMVLPLAVLVGVVSGYFWALCLLPFPDRAERMTLSTALSIAMVPVVALATVLGEGVKLIVAIASSLIVLGSSVVFYHQVSSMFLALLFALAALLLLPYLLLHDRRRGISLLLSLTLLGLLSTAYAWGTYDAGRVISGFPGGSETGTTASAVDMALGTQNIFALDYLIGAIVSQPVAWLGLFGAVLMVAGFRRPALPESLAWATLVAWALILFVGSRTSYSGFPQRFGRDLGMPLALLGALALVTVLRSLSTRRKPVEIVAAAVAVLLAGSLIELRAVQSLDQAQAPM